MRAERVVAFLRRHLPGALHCYGLIQEGAARIVDALPGGVLLQSRVFYSLYATDTATVRRLLEALPRDVPLGFSALPAALVDPVVEWGRASWRERFWMCYLPESQDLPPPPALIEPLEAKDASTVAQYWPYGGPSSVDYVEDRIRRGITGGVRVGGGLVAWALTHSDTSMGFLHVLDEHRGKGFAKAITYRLVAEIRRRGGKPFVYIGVNNVASLSLAERLGMRRVEQAEWLMLNEPDST